MNCWEAAQRIVRLIKRNEQLKILKILEHFSPAQKRFIVSIKYKYSPLIYIAVRHKLVCLVRYFLFICKADPNGRDCRYNDKLTCLTVASMLNSELLVDMLLKCGAKADLAWCLEQALYYACKKGNLEIAKLLIKHGANVNSQDFSGETCLMKSKDNFELFQCLIAAGANVNMANYLGDTCLLQSFENTTDEITSFLIDCQCVDVRLKNDFGEDALHLAVRCSSERIINRIIRKGCYTRREVIKVYEVQCCICLIKKMREKSKELWRKSCQLRRQSLDIPIFKNLHSTGKLQKVKKYFQDTDISALLYIESVAGLNPLMLDAFTESAVKVSNVDNYILCKFFFEIVQSLDNKYFFIAITQADQLIWHSFNLDNIPELSALTILEILAAYMDDIRNRLERMTPQERMPCVLRLESFLNTVIEIFNKINQEFYDSMFVFYRLIGRIVKLDLRGLSQKSLLHLCADMYREHLIEPIFLEHRADVNCSDKLGKTVLHTLVEVHNASSEIFKDIIEHGFDFRLVKYDEYCLRCRMEREGVLPKPVKHGSLQCLATKVFCQKTMNSFDDVPHHLMTIVNSHLCL